jgi:hypothetical protein
MKLLLDLVRLHRFIEGCLSSFLSCEVIPAGGLLAAKHGATPNEVLAAYSSWGAVHGSGASYTRMAQPLWTRSYLAPAKPQPLPPATEGSSKRKHAESSSSSGRDRHPGDSRRHSGSDRLPGFTHGGSNPFTSVNAARAPEASATNASANIGTAPLAEPPEAALALAAVAGIQKPLLDAPG